MNRFAALFVFFLAATLGPIGASAAQTHTSQTHTTASAHHAVARSRIDPALYHPTWLHARAPEVYEVTFVTTKGPFVVKVTRAWAPLGADRFYNLVRHRFYNNMALFRVVPGFVVQFGLGPSGAVNRVWEKATIKDDPVKASNNTGTLTFATAGANTRTTQVFINLANNGSSLDNQGFAPFGQVVSGMQVIENLYSGYGETTTNDQTNITNGGSAYLARKYPKLDIIKTATVTSPTATATHRAAARTAPSKR